MTHTISNNHLSLERLKSILYNHEKLELGDEARNAIVKCRSYLDSKMEDISRPVYGITTVVSASVQPSREPCLRSW